MLIPRGKALHENLATSYVLVDNLIADLCEGGFSGVVEVVLRDTDSYIMIDRGSVAVAVEKRGKADYSPATVTAIAARARRERGRVSIYSFSVIAIGALAGYFTSEPLYTDLSTEFADLEKMISKLSRERDRQWFIKVTMENDSTALLQIEENKCRVVRLDEDASSGNTGGLDRSSNPALSSLLEECNRVGGKFDVYFKQSGEPVPNAYAASATEDQALDSAQPESTGYEINASDSIRSEQYTPAEMAQPYRLNDLHEELMIGPQNKDSQAQPRAAGLPESMTQIVLSDIDETEGSAPNAQQEADALEMAREALTMAEVKRLTGEITRTIEDATRAVEIKDIFSMHLRAGQLQVADRYPFLDPFGVEFEYLAGEIVFVGKARSSDFIAGLTEALKLAVASVVTASSQPARLRAIIKEDLRKLAEHFREELAQFGLDESIERIIAD